MNLETCLEQYLGNGNFQNTELIAVLSDQQRQLFCWTDARADAVFAGLGHRSTRLFLRLHSWNIPPICLKILLDMESWTVYNIANKMTRFYDVVYSFELVRGCQFLKLYISMFEKWLESPQWLLAVSKPKVCMRVTSAWGQELAHTL